MEGSVNLNIKDGIGTIEFYHPQSNSLPAHILNNLAETIFSCGLNNDVRLIIGRVQGKAVGGGVGMACATDYCYATKYASVKLSELEIGIGPFVVGPAVERKTGVSAYSTLAINASKWFDANWAKDKGIYSEVFDSNELMDEAIEKLSKTLLNSNPEAMEGLKKVMWEGTDHWDTLLMERAVSSGTLVLSDFTRNAISKFKNK